MNNPFVKKDVHLSDGKEFTRALTRKEVGQNIKHGAQAFMKKANFIVVFGVILLIYVIASLVKTGSFSWGLFTNIFQSATTVGILGVGMAIIIILGQIDLSVGSSLAMVGGLSILTFNATYESIGLGGATVLTLIVAIGLGIACGAFNGFFIGFLKMPSFIVTLATMLAYRSIIQYVLFLQKDDMGQPLSTFRLASYTKASGNPAWIIGNTVPFAQITLTSIIFIVIVFLVWLLLTYSKFGRKVYAVGSNNKAASLVGIKPNWMILKVFALEGALIGIAAFLQVCMRGNIDAATTGAKFEMYAIASAVLGGISMAGGRGNMIGILFGAAAYDTIEKIILALGLPFQLNDAVKGIILIIAIIFQVVRYNKTEVTRFLQKLHLAYTPNKGLLLESELKRKIEELENATSKKVAAISAKTSDDSTAIELIRKEYALRDAKIAQLQDKYKVLIHNAEIAEKVHDNDAEINAQIAELNKEALNNRQYYKYLDQQAKLEAAPALAPYYNASIDLASKLSEDEKVTATKKNELAKNLGKSVELIDADYEFNKENANLVKMDVEAIETLHEKELQARATNIANLDKAIADTNAKLTADNKAKADELKAKAEAVVEADKVALAKKEANAPALKAKQEAAAAKAEAKAKAKQDKAEAKVAKEEAARKAKEDAEKVLKDRLAKLDK